MKWKAEHKEKHIICIAEDDQLRNLTTGELTDVVDLYIYENGKLIRDYVPGSLKVAQQMALRKFGVPLENWKEVKE